MTSFLSASNVSKSATNTQSRIVPSNSIYGVLTIADTVFKLESTNDFPLIQISAKATKATNILVQQSFDNVVEPGGVVPSLITTQVFAIVPEDPLDGLTVAQTFYAKITYPYFRVVLINTAGVAGNVYLTTKLVATPTTTSGGIATLNPTDDGVSVFGSNDGTTPLILNTDATGILNVNVVSGGGIATETIIKGSEDLIFAQEPISGIMYVAGAAGGLALDATLADVYNSTVWNTYNSTQVIAPFTVSGTFPLSVAANSAIPSTSVDLYATLPFAPSTSQFYYNSVAVLGTLSGITNAGTPQLCFQYSNDNTAWFGDGLYPTLLLVSGTTYSFAQQRTGMAARYVRVWAMAALTVESLVINRIHL